MKNLIPQEVIEKKIYLIRGHKVMLDRELAKLYGVTTFNLNKAVKRNLDRFPEDFMFQLNKSEAQNLIFQAGISSWGGVRKLPYAFTPLEKAADFNRRLSPLKADGGLKPPSASTVREPQSSLTGFTEQGVAMLSSALRSKRAIHVNIAIMRTFVKLKQILSTHHKRVDS